MKYAAMLLSALALTGCEVNLNSEGIVSRDTKKFTVAANPEIDLNTFDGSIEVHSWDRDEVEVEIERRAMEQRLVDEMQVTAEQQGNRVVVKVTGPRSDDDFDGVQIGVHFSPTARLRVVVPRNSQLVATTQDGSITVEDVTGKLTLRTGDGSVRGSRLAGEIFVRSGDGSIRFERVEGALDLETDDGGITLEGKPSALRAHTSDGTIRFDIEPDTAMAADWDLQTSDGSVILTLPPSFNAVLDAETRDGAVRLNHPAVSNAAREGEGEDGRERERRRRSVQTTLGAGGKVLRVRTGDGSIRIE
jgi:DUF4097 and DUF4098 domain-containing protein YvlB